MVGRGARGDARSGARSGAGGAEDKAAPRGRGAGAAAARGLSGYSFPAPALVNYFTQRNNSAF